MRIQPNDKPAELSYVDLLAALREDVLSDAIPQEIKNEILARIIALEELLEGFSA